MIRFNVRKRFVIPMVACAALALALLLGVAQAAPAGAEPLDPPANDVWPPSLEIGT